MLNFRVATMNVLPRKCNNIKIFHVFKRSINPRCPFMDVLAICEHQVQSPQVKTRAVFQYSGLFFYAREGLSACWLWFWEHVTVLHTHHQSRTHDTVTLYSTVYRVQGWCMTSRARE